MPWWRLFTKYAFTCKCIPFFVRIWRLDANLRWQEVFEFMLLAFFAATYFCCHLHHFVPFLWQDAKCPTCCRRWWRCNPKVFWGKQNSPLRTLSIYFWLEILIVVAEGTSTRVLVIAQSQLEWSIEAKISFSVAIICEADARWALLTMPFFKFRLFCLLFGLGGWLLSASAWQLEGLLFYLMLPSWAQVFFVLALRERKLTIYF